MRQMYQPQFHGDASVSENVLDQDEDLIGIANMIAIGITNVDSLALRDTAFNESGPGSRRTTDWFWFIHT